MGRKSTTGGVVPLNDRIQLDFLYRGQRCRPTLALPPTEPNLRHARRLIQGIKERIRTGTFDLAAEFPDYKGLSRFLDKPAAGASTLGDYIDKWTKSNARLKPSTLNGYRKIFTAYWRNWFGDKPIATIRYSDVTTKLGEQPWKSNKTYNNVLACGRVLWEMACKDDKTLANILKDIPFLDVQRPDPDPFSLDEIDQLLEKIRTRYGDDSADYCEFAFFTGMRPNEQIEIRWTDCDLPAGTVDVKRGRFKGQVREVKNYDSRTIMLHSRALAVLKRQEARTRAAGAHVFLHPRTGKPYADERAQRYYWASTIKILGIRYREPYQTRHSYATMLLMAGANPAWAAKQMGHSPQVFLKIYARWIDGKASGLELAKVERFTGKSTGKS